MKNKFFSSIIVTISLLTLVCLPFLSAAESAKTKIAISDFKANNPDAAMANREAIQITEQLIHALMENPSLDVLKPTSESADYLVMGSIWRDPTSPVDNLIVNLQIFNPTTSISKPIYAKKLILKSNDIEELNKKAVCQVENIINETLFPVKIDHIEGAYAYLKYKPGARLKNKMKIEVLIPSAYSVDPDTGEVVKGSEYAIGELKVTEIQPEFAKAQIIRYSSPIEPGAFCRTVPEC